VLGKGRHVCTHLVNNLVLLGGGELIRDVDGLVRGHDGKGGGGGEGEVRKVRKVDLLFFIERRTKGREDGNRGWAA
jgi:hypothetical protein